MGALLESASQPPLAVSPSPASARPRLESIDLLRGLIMVLMALDHTRAFFSNARFDPLDLQQTTVALFLTRWFTHFCAPNFIFLAGIGAFLTSTRGKTTRELSWFLFSRGLWLALLEVTWVKCLGWGFSFDYSFVGLGVLWAIGWSMVVLAGLVYLPMPGVASIGLGMIALHNALDPIRPEAFGRLAALWGILHVSGGFELPGFRLGVGYPLIPWIGVMAAGYSFGTIYRWEPERRRKVLWRLGLGLIVLFVILRGLNGYGNPHGQDLGRELPNGQWSLQKNWVYTIFSFIDVHKYPPSLDFLLVTIGPAMILLSRFERGTPRLLRLALVFGRVPLFYYLLHIPLIHGLAVIANALQQRFAMAVDGREAARGFDLWVVYLVWAAVVLILYPVCCWFAELKRRRNDRWLSYL